MPFAFDSREQLDAYLAALQAVIARHDILRTAVVWEGLPEPVQVVWRARSAPGRRGGGRPGRGRGGEAAVRALRPAALPHRPGPGAHAARLRQPRGRRGALGAAAAAAPHGERPHHGGGAARRRSRRTCGGRADQLPAPLPFRNYVAQARLGVSRAEHEAFFRELLGDVDEPTAPFGLRDVQGDGLGLERGAAAGGRGAGRAAAGAGAAAGGEPGERVPRGVGAGAGAGLAAGATWSSGRCSSGACRAGRERTGCWGRSSTRCRCAIRVGEEGAEASVRRTQALLASLVRHEHASLALAQQCSGGAGAGAAVLRALQLPAFRKCGRGGRRTGATRGPRQAMHVHGAFELPAQPGRERLGR